MMRKGYIWCFNFNWQRTCIFSIIRWLWINIEPCMLLNPLDAHKYNILYTHQVHIQTQIFFTRDNSSIHSCTPGLCFPAVGQKQQAVTYEQRGRPRRDGHLDWDEGEWEIRANGGKANGEKAQERKWTSGCNTALEGKLHLAICNVSREVLAICVAPMQKWSYKQHWFIIWPKLLREVSCTWLESSCLLSLLGVARTNLVRANIEKTSQT